VSRLPFIRIVGIAADTLCGFAPLPAQRRYQPGDVIVGAVSPSSQNAILGITPQGTLYTLVPLISFIPYAITASPDNRSLQVGGRGLLRIAPDGTVTSVSLGLPLGLMGLDVDGSGDVILSRSSGSLTQPGVLRITRGIPTTLYARPLVGVCVGAGIDLRSGDLILTGQRQGSPVEIMRATLHGAPTVSSINTLVPSIVPGYYAFPRHDPATDTFLLFSGYARIDSFSVRSPGKMTTVFRGPPLYGWVMLNETASR
jgi:hypothetical protein